MATLRPTGPVGTRPLPSFTRFEPGPSACATDSPPCQSLAAGFEGFDLATACSPLHELSTSAARVTRASGPASRLRLGNVELSCRAALHFGGHCGLSCRSARDAGTSMDDVMEAAQVLRDRYGPDSGSHRNDLSGETVMRWSGHAVPRRKLELRAARSGGRTAETCQVDLHYD